MWLETRLEHCGLHDVVIGKVVIPANASREKMQKKERQSKLMSRKKDIKNKKNKKEQMKRRRKRKTRENVLSVRYAGPQNKLLKLRSEVYAESTRIRDVCDLG